LVGAAAGTAAQAAAPGTGLLTDDGVVALEAAALGDYMQRHARGGSGAATMRQVAAAVWRNLLTAPKEDVQRPFFVEARGPAPRWTLGDLPANIAADAWWCHPVVRGELTRLVVTDPAQMAGWNSHELVCVTTHPRTRRHAPAATHPPPRTLTCRRAHTPLGIPGAHVHVVHVAAVQSAHCPRVV